MKLVLTFLAMLSSLPRVAGFLGAEPVVLIIDWLARPLLKGSGGAYSWWWAGRMKGSGLSLDSAFPEKGERYLLLWLGGLGMGALGSVLTGKLLWLCMIVIYSAL